jgi:hypothetical protein
MIVVTLVVQAEDFAMEADVVARAYDLAPNCSKLDELRNKLKSEGYANVDGHFSSGQLKAELTKRLAKPLAEV